VDQTEPEERAGDDPDQDPDEGAEAFVAWGDGMALFPRCRGHLTYRTPPMNPHFGGNYYPQPVWGGKTLFEPARRHFIRSLPLLGYLAAAGACGEDRSSDGPVTLVFKHARILGPADPIPRLLRDFERLHPGVKVRAESLPWNSDEQRQFFVINLEGGRPGFDVMMLDVIWVAEFARAGWLLDLTPHLAADELAPHFPSAVEAARYDGRTWALPWLMNVGLLYYRKDLLDREGLGPPGTYAEMVGQIQRVRAAARERNLHGYLWQGKQYEGLVVNALEGFWAAGTELLGPGGDVLPDPSRAASALGFLRTAIQTGLSPPWVTAADEELTRRPFGQGEAIFLRNWPYAMDLFQQPGSPVRGRVAMASLPRHLDGRAGSGATGGAHLAIQRGTSHPEAALALVRFLAGEPAQKAMAAGAALNPTRMALYHDPDLVREHPHLPEVMALMLRGRPRPVSPYYLMMSTRLQPELSAALVGVKTPARAVADARRALEFMLQDVGAPGARS
jgi:multiple sugar transport system substrate-binding protein